jgi:hypothetical protein
MGLSLLFTHLSSFSPLRNTHLSSFSPLQKILDIEFFSIGNLPLQWAGFENVVKGSVYIDFENAKAAPVSSVTL